MSTVVCGIFALGAVWLLAAGRNRRGGEAGSPNVFQAHARGLGTYLPPGVVGTSSIDVSPAPEIETDPEHTLHVEAPVWPGTGGTGEE